MYQLIPRYIAQLRHRNQAHGRLTGATLFADLSGFTAVTERLMQDERTGADELRRILNLIFTRLATRVYAHGGFITDFAGDAFTAVFPGGDADAAGREGMQQALTTARKMMLDMRENPTEYGLGLKIGVSYGAVQAHILGDEDRAAYLFMGEAIVGCARAEEQAQTDWVVLDRAAQIACGDGRFRLRDHPTAEDFFVLEEALPPDGAEDVRLPDDTAESQSPDAFSHPSVAAFVAGKRQGEFRHVIVISAVFNVAHMLDERGRPSSKLKAFMPRLLARVDQAGGYFDKLTFDDKGLTALIIFGAPVAHENDTVEAARLLGWMQQTLPPQAWRAGVSVGQVYAGLLGMPHRGEYTVLGDTVNLGVRIAQAMPWDVVGLSPQTADLLRPHWTGERVGTYQFKGMAQPLTVWQLRRQADEAAELVSLPRETTLTLRQDEREALYTFVAPLQHGRFAHVLFLLGEAGMGKRTLMQQLHEHAQTHQLRWLQGEGQEILSTSLAPFRALVRHYFGVSRTAALDTWRDSFINQFQTLVTEIAAQGHTYLSEQLNQRRHFLGRLLSAQWENPIYEMVTPEMYFEQTRDSIILLIRGLCRLAPTVLHLAHVQWFDQDSLTVLQALLKQVRREPLAVVIDGRVDLPTVRRMVALPPAVDSIHIVLENWSPEEVRLFLTQTLRGDVADELVHMLAERTAGNPYFLSQMVSYMQDQDRLVKNGVWEATTYDLEGLPRGVNTLLLAQVDRLSPEARRLVSRATVFGKQFLTPLLTYLMSAPFDEAFREVERQGVWTHIEADAYHFRHTLLWEAVYESQLPTHLQAWHGRAAEAYQAVYADAPADYYGDVAYHLEQAQSPEAAEWYRRAAEHHIDIYANELALHDARKALKLLPAGDATAADRYDLLLMVEKVLGILGRREEQQQALNDLHTLAGQLEDDAKHGRVYLREAAYHEQMSKDARSIAAAQKAIAHAERIPDAQLETQGYLQWGRTLWSNDEYAKAETYLLCALDLAREHGLIKEEADCLRNLAPVAHFQNNPEKAAVYLEKSLPLSHELGDVMGEGNALTNLGNIVLFMGDHGRAEQLYAEALTTYEQIGARRGQAMAHTNLAVLYLEQGNAGRAYDYCEMAVKLNREVDDGRGMAQALINLARAQALLGLFTEARRNYEQAHAAAERLEDRMGLAWSLLGLTELDHQAGAGETAQTRVEELLTVVEELSWTHLQGFVYTLQGNIRRAGGDHQQGQAAYQSAVEIRSENDESVLLCETNLNLARLPHIGRSQRHQILDEALPVLKTGDLYRIRYPLRLYLLAHRLLRDNERPAEAADCLQWADAWAAARLADIDRPALKEAFQNSPDYQRLAALRSV